MRTEKYLNEIGKADDSYSRQKLIGKIRTYAETLKKDVHLKKRVSFTDGVVNECIDALNKLSKNNKIHENNSQQKVKRNEFVARNSILTDLFEIEHFRTIRTLFTAVLILFFVYNIIEEYYLNSSSKLQTILWNLNKLHKVFYIWIIMFASTYILVYKTFQFWASNVNRYKRVWNKFWLTIYLFYMIAFLYFPSKYILISDLPPVCSIIVLMEQLRMIMKTHSFVRSNAAKVLEKPNSTKCPEMSKYLYFLFAPTLIYEDDYPRNLNINFKFVITNFCHVIACTYYITIIFFDYFTVFNDFGLSTSSSRQVIKSIISSIVPGVILMFCLNFLLLHSWLNAIAELLRFSDRQFYTDWWNSRHFSVYYRSWNLVVHDWLHKYIFRDVAMYYSSNRFITITCVFLISSIFHDYIMTIAFRFFLPVHLILFAGFGELFYFLPTKHCLFNISVVFWMTLIAGTTIEISIYSIEFYARKNCPLDMETLIDAFVPRMWVCFQNVTSSK